MPPLPDLLWQLLDHDKQVRSEADDRLYSWHQDDPDTFATQVRDAVDALGAERPRFIRTLLESRQDKPSFWLGHAKVVDALDLAFLDAPDLLAERIQNGDSQMLEVLHRIGPAAREFAPLLLNNHQNLSAAWALASIVRDDPQCIAAVTSWLFRDDAFAQFFALSFLRHLGPGAEHLVPGTLSALCLTLLGGKEPEKYHAIEAIASVGRHDPVMLDVVLGQRTIAPSTVFDALGYFTDFPERAVAALIDALESFEEYDPDWTWHGDHARIATALMRFGDKAALAVDALIVRIFDESGKVNRRVVQCLGNMGPVAAAALPFLEPLCDDDDDIAAAVGRLRGLSRS